MATKSRLKNMPAQPHKNYGYGTTANSINLPHMPKGPSVTYKPIWENANKTTFNRAESERLAAEKLLEEAKSLIEDARVRVDKGEVEVDVRLKLRTTDVDFWKSELDNKLADIKQEIDEVHNLKIRTDSECRSCIEPINITTQCITFRGGRQGCDLIRDEVDMSLDHELDTCRSSQALLGQTSSQLEEQLRLLRKCKYTIEKEHNEKEMAQQVDAVTKGIKITSLNGKKTQGRSTSVHMPRGGAPVTVSDWMNLTQQNLQRAVQTLEGNIESVVNGILARVASNMKTCVDVSDLAFNRRLSEIRDAKTKLEEQKSETNVKIQEVDDTIQSLERALMAKQGPLASTQAKIQQRKMRPGAELCHDEVDVHLAREHRNLLDIINKLEGGILQAKHCYAGLQKTLLELEDEIAKKANSIYIDEVKCLTLRKSISINMY